MFTWCDHIRWMICMPCRPNLMKPISIGNDMAMRIKRRYVKGGTKCILPKSKWTLWCRPDRRWGTTVSDSNAAPLANAQHKVVAIYLFFCFCIYCETLPGRQTRAQTHHLQCYRPIFHSNVDKVRSVTVCWWTRFHHLIVLVCSVFVVSWTIILFCFMSFFGVTKLTNNDGSRHETFVILEAKNKWYWSVVDWAWVFGKWLTWPSIKMPKLIIITSVTNFFLEFIVLCCLHFLVFFANALFN